MTRLTASGRSGPGRGRAYDARNRTDPSCQGIDRADRLYPRHEIAVVDAHTISMPGGGTRYVPMTDSGTASALCWKPSSVRIVDLAAMNGVSSSWRAKPGLSATGSLSKRATPSPQGCRP